jgi:hypothetical protein
MRNSRWTKALDINMFINGVPESCYTVGMPPRLNVIGASFGQLVVVEDLDSPLRRRRVRCRCTCGVICTVALTELRRGDTKSCGCLKRELTRSRNFRHGEGPRDTRRRTVEYRAWQEMKRRCLSVHRRGFHCWGGRGISVSPLWINDFPRFLQDVGRRPTRKHSLDRFPDNNGHYEPGNVRWATMAEQARNRRSRSELPPWKPRKSSRRPTSVSVD